MDRSIMRALGKRLAEASGEGGSQNWSKGSKVFIIDRIFPATVLNQRFGDDGNLLHYEICYVGSSAVYTAAPEEVTRECTKEEWYYGDNHCKATYRELL